MNLDKVIETAKKINAVLEESGLSPDEKRCADMMAGTIRTWSTLDPVSAAPEEAA